MHFEGEFSRRLPLLHFPKRLGYWYSYPMTKRVIITSVFVVIALAAGIIAFLATQNKPAPNRCTPIGDPREAVVDCAEFKYYDPALEH
jgi:hypothetical protein